MVQAPLQAVLSSSAPVSHRIVDVVQIGVETSLQFAVTFTFAILVLVFVFGSLAVQAVLIWWTYTDAVEHSEESPALWAVAVLVAPLLGLLLYLLVGRGEETL